MNILIVGGTFDDTGGKPSGFISKFSLECKKAELNFRSFNGGYYDQLVTTLSGADWADVIMWFANVPNDKPKMDIKKWYPKKLLVMSKRNNDEYSFAELINRALKQKANLMIEFNATDRTDIRGRVFDPLGIVWCDFTTDIKQLVEETVYRLEYLNQVTRKPTLHQKGNAERYNPGEHFYRLIKEYSEDFHRIINPDNTVERFLGNTSFRCQNGFPSFRTDGLVFVTQRNIDKRMLSPEAFVATKLVNGDVHYWGENKPSVDTPIQLRLYEQLPNINFMLHAHVYIKDAPFTNTPVPCGAIEEVDEIMSVIDSNTNFAVVNLKGHGSIVMTSQVEQLENIPFIARDIPERIS